MKLITILLFLTIAQLSFSQAPKIYDPTADAKLALKKAVSDADSLTKHVLVMIGGNWCPWCLKINKFLFEDEVLDSIVKANYIVVKVNYSKENMNLDVLKSLDFPQRFGFPVMVILNNKGARIHTQDSGFLESDETYDRKKMTLFLNNWSFHALMPENYVKK
ncbi:MAG: hypothetical protein A2046_05485 [Bacteroidetes bacterium GWA2_30_7]|nr:MAG: hypothetical protein A2046_05485 [Bacteroidetes bacterium GWA2_30_7]